MIAGETDARAYVERFADTAALARLELLERRLREESTALNLVARATLDSVWQRHFADSVQLLEHVPRETPGPWLDLGTGAGFPGLVIAALLPGMEVWLVESRRRRILWLEEMCAAMGLARCRVAGARLEQVESFPAGVISARAFAPLPRLLDLSARFSTAATVWLLPKGRSATQELEALPLAKRRLFHVEQSRTDPEAGIIVGRLEQKARHRP